MSKKKSPKPKSLKDKLSRQPALVPEIIKPQEPISKLNAKHEKFCHEYLLDRNSTQAYIRAGYKARGARANAARLIANDSVKARINQLISADLNRLQITADKIKRELMNHAFINIADAYDENGALKPFEDMPIELQRVIVAVETEDLYDGQGKERKMIGYSKRIKLTDKLKALELLGRHFKMFTDVVEHTNLDNLAEELKAARLRSGQTPPCMIPQSQPQIPAQSQPSQP